MCDLVQPRVPFTDLTRFISPEALDALDASLAANLVKGATTPFLADDLKHADAVELCDKDTSQWPPAAATEDAFRTCRRRRGDPSTWRPNENAATLRELSDFARDLEIFEATGKIAVLVNAPGSTGVEHVDHTMPDLVSEFLWIRPKWSTKIFYAKDRVTGNFPSPFEARISVSFHSFRLILGREIISRRVLEECNHLP